MSVVIGDYLLIELSNTNPHTDIEYFLSKQMTLDFVIFLNYKKINKNLSTSKIKKVLFNGVL